MRLHGVYWCCVMYGDENHCALHWHCSDQNGFNVFISNTDK